MNFFSVSFKWTPGLSIKNILVLSLLCLCPFQSGCFVYNKLKAKDSLNNGARLYNAGKYDKAAQLFKEAVDLNPDLVQARLFYATSLRSQVVQSTDAPNVQLAKDAIKEYEEVIRRSSKYDDKDQSFAFIADLYSKIDDVENQKKWLESRANLPSQKNNIKAQCYYAISVSYWEAVHKVSDKYFIPGGLKYKPVSEWDTKDKDTATTLIQLGLKYNSQALAADPEYANTYSYLNLFYREQIKIESDPKRISELTKQADQAVEKFQELNRKAASEQVDSSATKP